MGNVISKAIDFIGDLFRRTPYKSIEFRDGLIRVDFYFKPNSARHTYVLISTANNVFNLKLDGRLYAYGYLLAALEQGKTEQIEGYAMTMWQVATGIVQEQGFCDDVQRAINKRVKRIFKQAEREAKQHNDAKEEYDSAIMDAIIDASEDKRSRKQRVKEMREVLNEDK